MLSYSDRCCDQANQSKISSPVLGNAENILDKDSKYSTVSTVNVERMGSTIRQCGPQRTGSGLNLALCCHERSEDASRIKTQDEWDLGMSKLPSTRRQVERREKQDLVRCQEEFLWRCGTESLSRQSRDHEKLIPHTRRVRPIFCYHTTKEPKRRRASDVVPFRTDEDVVDAAMHSLTTSEWKASCIDTNRELLKAAQRVEVLKCETKNDGQACGRDDKYDTRRVCSRCQESW